MRINSAYFEVPKDGYGQNEIAIQMMRVDAALAEVLRSSMKYVVSAETLVTLQERHTDAFRKLYDTQPLHLPHLWSTVIVNTPYMSGDETLVMIVQQQTPGKDYPELGIGPDDPFLCINAYSYTPRVEHDDGTIEETPMVFHWPIELHAELGKSLADAKVLYAGADDITTTERGQTQLDMLWYTFSAWVSQFHLSAVERTLVDGARVPKGWKPRKKSRPRKQRDHPLFEHIVMQVEADAPEPGHGGKPKMQPPKRLHLVRGFWRTYKSGKRVWVRPHVRGNAQLGVVRRDVELVAHEEPPQDVRSNA
jgi:hypothetical protein